MAAKFTPGQRALINSKSKPKELDPADEAGELNIVPFLDIITNLLMFILATITTVFTATITVPAPSSRSGGGGGGQDDKDINLTVQVLKEGFVVAAQGGFIQRGTDPNNPCTVVGAATITVPKINDQYDIEGLTKCMVGIRNKPEWKELLADKHNIQVGINADIKYRDMVRTLDALRESRPGARDLFYEPVLGLLR